MTSMFALVLAALVQHVPQQPSIRDGAAAPDFTVALGQNSVELSKLRGKPVVLNFWATWCKPCTDELKYFTQAQAVYGSRIAIITVSSEPHDVAASYFRLWNIDLPLVEDPTGSISRLYDAPPIPVTVVVGPDGTIDHVSLGELDKGELDAAIEKALATPAIGSPSPKSAKIAGL